MCWPSHLAITLLFHYFCPFSCFQHINCSLAVHRCHCYSHHLWVVWTLADQCVCDRLLNKTFVAKTLFIFATVWTQADWDNGDVFSYMSICLFKHRLWAKSNDWSPCLNSQRHSVLDRCVVLNTLHCVPITLTAPQPYMGTNWIFD